MLKSSQSSLWNQVADPWPPPDEWNVIRWAPPSPLRRGDGGAHLITFHSSGGGQGSATWFHNDDWLDFNMLQNGHGGDSRGHVFTRQLYDLVPTKPVIDGEPLYE